MPEEREFQTSFQRDKMVTEEWKLYIDSVKIENIVSFEYMSKMVRECTTTGKVPEARQWLREISEAEELGIELYKDKKYILALKEWFDLCIIDIINSLMDGATKLLARKTPKALSFKPSFKMGD
jgi:hypothetical protein